MTNMNESMIQIPAIPEHNLIKLIGRGGYGEVWLANNELGGKRAIKIVRRSSFDDDRPYEREWSGIKEYEPISRKHEGLISILQVGRDNEAGLFYYVMDLADNAREADTANLQDYTPKSLKSELENSSFSIEKTYSTMNSVLKALDHLHKNNLVHRDLKPSNILYLDGKPCLADPGLISSIDSSLSVVGTIGYMPREGPGRSTGDVFSMGIILYEMLTGKERCSFPELGDSFLSKRSDLVAGLNQAMMKACNDEAKKRHQNAGEFLDDLDAIINGSSREKTKGKLSTLTFAAGFVIILSIIFLIWRPDEASTQNFRELDKPNAESSTQNNWDFEYSFTHVHATNAMTHIVERENIQRFTEWQRPPHTYWAPVENDIVAKLTYKFEFPNPTSEVFLHAVCDAWNFESEINSPHKAKGTAAILASVDGRNWVDLVNRISPSIKWGPGKEKDGTDLRYNDELPAELTGSKQLWIQIQLLCSGVSPDAIFYPVQHGRSYQYDPENPLDKKLFELRARYKNDEQPVNIYTQKEEIRDVSEKEEAGSSYQIINGNFTWHEAKEDAEKRGGHLAVITSQEENKTINNLILNHSEEYPHLWIGGTDEANEGDWKWITGEPWIFDNWFSLESQGRPDMKHPDNAQGSEHYLQVYREPNEPLKGGIYWDDKPLRSFSHGYILESNLPFNVDFLIKKGNKARQRKEHSQAMELYKRALKIDPKSFNALFEMASLATYIGKEPEALEAWNKAIAIHPNDVPARLNRALVLAILKQLNEAEKDLLFAIQLDPNNASAHFQTGTFYKDEKNNIAKCRIHYKRALEIDPDHEFKNIMTDWLTRYSGN